MSRGLLKTLIGTVISNKADKTITVRVPRKFKHPRYGKYVITHKKYTAHDETNRANIGDEVKICFSKPISKTKRWRLLDITRKVVEV